MKWCRYTANGSTSYGIIEGDTVQEISGDPFGEHAKTGASHRIEAVQLEVPVIPPTFYAAGINYPEHVTWAAQMRGQEPNLPKRADVGYRAINALVPHGHDIIVPADATEELQYEGELVVVMGKTCGPSSSGGQRDPSTGLRLRVHHRQRCQRAILATERPHHVAGQEH